MQFEFLGLKEYSAAYEYQLSKHQQVLENPDKVFILGLEHPAVITLGRRAEPENEVNSSLCNHIPVIKSSRGGLATVHSEGQLVIYTIVHIRHRRIGVKNLVQLLLNTTREALSSYGVESYIDEALSGVYTKKGKIAFCGLQINNGISLHGMSINIANNLNYFESIIPCGSQNQKMDRLVDNQVIMENSTHTRGSITEEFFKKWQEFFLRSIAKDWQHNS